MSTSLPVYTRAHTVKLHTCPRCTAEVKNVYGHKDVWVCFSGTKVGELHSDKQFGECGSPNSEKGDLHKHKKKRVCASCLKALGVPEKTREPKKYEEKAERWPERCLIFDTEVRTTMDGKHGYQALTFGIFRVCVLVNGEYKCVREGAFYSGESDKGSKALEYAASAVLDKDELNAVGKFVSTELPDVEARSFPPRMKLEVYQTFTAFMEKVFWREVQRGSLITCFNSPFDLSRLSRDWRPSRRGGFSLIMGHRFWQKTKKWVRDPYRPVIRIEPQNARVAFISRGGVKGKWKWKPDVSLTLGHFCFRCSISTWDWTLGANTSRYRGN
jgi:hypothetical protein